MNDHQEQELEQQQQTLESEQGFIPTEGSLDNRLSLLHLDQRTMEATNGADHISASDAEPFQVPVAAPSPTRAAYGSKTPMKRRSPSSTFAPPLQTTDSDAGYHQMLSEGYRVLPIPSAGNERTAATSPRNAPPLCRCSSLSSTNGIFLNPPAEIPSRGVAAIPENRTRRPLFTSPANGSSGPASHTLPPLHPLTRAFSDPIPFSYLENPILPNREKGPSAPRVCVGNVSVLDSNQDTPSCKRLKRISIHRIRQQMNKLMDEMAIQESLVDDSTNDSELSPADDKVVNCHGRSEEVGTPELDKEIKEEAEEPEAGTVSTERIGDCTHLEFKCRCGSGYSIRIIGHDFFYKLI